MPLKLNLKLILGADSIVDTGVDTTVGVLVGTSVGVIVGTLVVTGVEIDVGAVGAKVTIIVGATITLPKVPTRLTHTGTTAILLPNCTLIVVTPGFTAVA